MADPQTTNLGFYTPTTGSDVDTWALPVNANTTANDNLNATTASIALTTGAVTLTTPPNSGASWAGPYQSQSAVLKFTGTLVGNCTITLPRPGFFIVNNQCTVGAFYVALASAAPGKIICAPPGAPTQIFCDGTDVYYVNLGPVGAALDLQAVTDRPAWMRFCTTPPYLVKDGSIYNFSDFPALGQLLGSTFGGNGVTTFGLPDERQRVRLPYDPSNSVARITAVIANIMGTAGGDQNLQQHLHGVTDPTHAHVISQLVGNSWLVENAVNTSGSTGYFPRAGGAGGTNQTSNVATGVTVNNAGTGGGQNLQPSILTFIPLIKT